MEPIRDDTPTRNPMSLAEMLQQPDSPYVGEEGAIITPEDDGGVTVDFTPPEEQEDEDIPFDANLAEYMDESELNALAQEILKGIEADEQSREDWEATYTKGMSYLGLKMEDASGDVSVQGSISKVYHPLLLEAVVRYQANSMGELLPASGPVKVRDDEVQMAPPPQPQQPPMGIPGAPMQLPLMPAASAQPPKPKRDELADAFEKDFNHYLTVVAKEYYPNFDKMLFEQGFSGCVVRKMYHCPLRRRPVSEYITGMDFIVSNTATSLYDCGRKTHRIKMRKSVLKRMQLAGAYRDVELMQPTEKASQGEEKIKEIEGLTPTPQLPEDNRYTIYESYVEYDLKGFEHKENGEITGLPLPYKVVLDKDSVTVLEIRRNWKEGDPEFQERRIFVKYGLIPGFGFYDYGFVHLLGNTTRALTALERQLLDAGQFANFPGLLIAKQNGRQETNQIRIPPAGAQEIDTMGMPLQSVVMPLPYKEPSQVLAGLTEKIAQDARQLAATTELQVGDGRADAPVGTTVALLEQATKVMASVHKRNHRAQQEEFEILRELFIEDPSALWRFAKTPARRWEMGEEFKDMLLVPASDPNVPSHIHRLLQSSALVQLAASAPQMYNMKEVHERALRIMNVQDTDALFAPPPPPNPMTQAAAEYVKAQTEELMTKAKKNIASATKDKVETLGSIVGTPEQEAKERERKMQQLIEIQKLAHKEQELDIRRDELSVRRAHQALGNSNPFGGHA